jgi:transposase-like protein
VTQILLPTALTLRRADSTEAIGNVLVAKAGGAGYRSIATRFGRPESTVRRWLRGVREPHAQWLYRRGVDRAAAIDRELLVRPAPQRSVLGRSLGIVTSPTKPSLRRPRNRFRSSSTLTPSTAGRTTVNSRRCRVMSQFLCRRGAVVYSPAWT